MPKPILMPYSSARSAPQSAIRPPPVQPCRETANRISGLQTRPQGQMVWRLSAAKIGAEFLHRDGCSTQCSLILRSIVYFPSVSL